MPRARVLSVDEVAAYLKINTKTVYRLLSLRRLRGVKVGSHWRVFESDLNRYLMSRANTNK